MSGRGRKKVEIPGVSVMNPATRLTKPRPHKTAQASSSKQFEEHLLQQERTRGVPTPDQLGEKITANYLKLLQFVYGNHDSDAAGALERVRQKAVEQYEEFTRTFHSKELIVPTAGSVGVDYMTVVIGDNALAQLSYACSMCIDTIVLHHSLLKLDHYHFYRSNIIRQMFQMGWRMMSNALLQKINSILASAPMMYRPYPTFAFVDLDDDHYAERKRLLGEVADGLYSSIMILYEVICMTVCFSDLLSETNVAEEKQSSTTVASNDAWERYVTGPQSLINIQCQLVMRQHARFFGLFYPLEALYEYRAINISGKVVGLVNYLRKNVVTPLIFAASSEKSGVPSLSQQQQQELYGATPAPESSSSSSSSSVNYPAVDDILDEQPRTPVAQVDPHLMRMQMYPSPQSVDEEHPHNFVVALYNARGKLQEIFRSLFDHIERLRPPVPGSGGGIGIPVGMRSSKRSVAAIYDKRSSGETGDSVKSRAATPLQSSVSSTQYAPQFSTVLSHDEGVDSPIGNYSDPTEPSATTQSHVASPDVNGDRYTTPDWTAISMAYLYGQETPLLDD